MKQKTFIIYLIFTFISLISYSQTIVKYKALKTGYTKRDYKSVSESSGCNIPVMLICSRDYKYSFYIGTKKEQLFDLLGSPAILKSPDGTMEINMFGATDFNKKSCTISVIYFNHPKQYTAKIEIYYPNPSLTSDAYYYMLVNDK